MNETGGDQPVLTATRTVCPRIAKQRKKSSSVIAAADGTTDCHLQMNLELFPCQNPAHPRMRQRERRLETFLQESSTWPAHHINATPWDIAQAGFYYIGTSDIVKCWYCNQGIRNWETNDDPWEEHAKYFPNCEFLLQQKGLEYVQQICSASSHLSTPSPISNSATEEQTNPSKKNSPVRASNQLRENFSISQPSNPQIDSQLPCQNPKNPHLQSGEIRFRTFANRAADWPEHRINASPKDFADAGFFYLGVRDCVRCWYCDGGLLNWRQNDDPWEEHAKWYPKCEFLLEQKGSEFISKIGSRYSFRRISLLSLPMATPGLPKISSLINILNNKFQDSSYFELDAPDPREKLEETLKGIERRLTPSEFFKQARLIGSEDGKIIEGFMSESSKNSPSQDENDDVLTNLLETRGKKKNSKKTKIFRGKNTSRALTSSNAKSNTSPSSIPSVYSEYIPSRRIFGQRLFNPQFRSCEVRLQTFINRAADWPDYRINATTKEFSDAGFYYLGVRDCVRCWYCHGGLLNWKPNDDPWEEHAKWYSKCEFVIRQKGEDYVARTESKFPNKKRSLLSLDPDVCATLSRVKTIINPLDTSSFNLDASDPRENLEELICCIEQKMTSSAFFKKARLIDRLDGMILAGITDEEAEGNPITDSTKNENRGEKSNIGIFTPQSSNYSNENLHVDKTSKSTCVEDNLSSKEICKIGLWNFKSSSNRNDCQLSDWVRANTSENTESCGNEAEQNLDEISTLVCSKEITVNKNEDDNRDEESSNFPYNASEDLRQPQKSIASHQSDIDFLFSKNLPCNADVEKGFEKCPICQSMMKEDVCNCLC